MNKDTIKDKITIRQVLEYYGNIPPKNERGNWECTKHHSSGKASLSVDEKQGICNCFNGCYGGDIYSVIATYEDFDLRKDFSKIINKACEIGNLPKEEISLEEIKNIEEIRKRKEILERSHKLFFEETKKYISQVKDYIFKKRNISEEDLKKIDLGFLPKEKILEIKEIIKKEIPESSEIKYYSEQDKKEKSLLDTYHNFENRIIHPHYYLGKLVYLTGEITPYSGEEKGKYVKLNHNFSLNNNAEGYLLDNLNSKEDNLIFAEGYWDALKLENSGVPAITFGTCKISQNFIENCHNKLNKFDKVIICFDTEDNHSGLDGAKSLSKRLIDLGAKNIFLSKLPMLDNQKTDIDSFLSSFPSEKRKEKIFENIVNTSIPYHEILLEDLRNESVELKREKIIQELFQKEENYGIETIMKIEKECREILGINKNELKEIKKKILDKIEEKNQFEETPITFTSGIIEKDFIAEEILNDEGEILFCSYYPNEDKIKYEKTVEYKNRIYYPIKDEEILTKKIPLPSKATPYESLDKLDLEIKEFITKWLDIPDEMVDYYVLSIRQSWVYDAFHSLNYPRAMGEHATGKTRFLDTIGLLHYKPIPTSGASSSAVIFRVCEKYHGTLIIDEADRKESDETDDLIKIINQGYEKGKYIMRCGQNDLNSLEFFDPFCPKVLATRKEFQDKATESRCMTTIMKETTRKDIPRNLTKEFWLEINNLRNKLLFWRLKNHHKIDPDAGLNINWGELEPRLIQVNSSFISLFPGDEEKIQKFLKYLMNQQGLIVEQRAISFEGQIVLAIKELIEEGKPLTASNIIDKGNFKNKAGYSLKSSEIGQTMRVLGFKPTIPKRYGQNVFKVYPYEQEFLDNLIRKFVPKNNLLLAEEGFDSTLKDNFLEDKIKISFEDVT